MDDPKSNSKVKQLLQEEKTPKANHVYYTPQNDREVFMQAWSNKMEVFWGGLAYHKYFTINYN